MSNAVTATIMCESFRIVPEAGTDLEGAPSSAFAPYCVNQETRVGLGVRSAHGTSFALDAVA